MYRALSILSLAVLLACSSNENGPKDASPAMAVKRAAAFCNTSQSEMNWILELIESTKDDHSLNGPIYAFRSNGQSIFMHQPWIMSCMACILYDCEGNRIDSQSIDQTVLAQGFQNLNNIYVPKME